MTVYAGSKNVKVGPGTLYAAPLGTAEPTACTGAWPTGWVALGYTAQGSTFTYQISTSALTPDEEYDPVLNLVTARTATVSFNLWEYTKQNLMLSFNAGIGSSQQTAAQGTNADGSLWVEPPTPGTETRVMLGWDALPLGNATSTTADPFGRMVMRQCLQTGSVAIDHRKGANPAAFTDTFTLEKPATGLNICRTILPAALAA